MFMKWKGIRSSFGLETKERLPTINGLFALTETPIREHGIIPARKVLNRR